MLFFLLSQTASAFLFSRSQGLERASYSRLINGLNSKNSREFFLPELNADSAEQFNTRLYYANQFEPSDDMYETKLWLSQILYRLNEDDREAIKNASLNKLVNLSEVFDVACMVNRLQDSGNYKLFLMDLAKLGDKTFDSYVDYCNENKIAWYAN